MIKINSLFFLPKGVYTEVSSCMSLMLILIVLPSFNWLLVYYCNIRARNALVQSQGVMNFTYFSCYKAVQNAVNCLYKKMVKMLL